MNFIKALNRKLFIYSFFLIIVLFTHLPFAAAHTGIFLPQIKINKEFVQENMTSHFIMPKSIVIPMSEAPQVYRTQETLIFEATGLTLTQADTSGIYQWNFGDNTVSQTGVSVRHVYQNPGSYEIVLKKQPVGKDEYILVDTIKIDITGSAKYARPKAKINVEGKSVEEKYINTVTVDKDTITLDGTNSEGDIKEFFWEFESGKKFTGDKITYTYQGQSNSDIVVLRVTDTNNLTSDQYTYIVFTNRSNALNQSQSGTPYIVSNEATFKLADYADSVQIFFHKIGSFIPISAVVLFILIYVLSSRARHSELHGSGQFLSIIQRITPYIRRIVYIAAVIWATVLYSYCALSIPTTGAALSALMRYYALTALMLLFIVLTPGLLRVYYPLFPLNGLFITARKAFGISLFFFAFLHATIGFYNNLSGNFLSIFFLAGRHQIALIFSEIAFVIFCVMAVTSINKVAGLIGHQRWKLLHRFIYVAGLLVLVHAFFIGSHFTNPYSRLPLFINFMSVLYIFLEVGATYKELKKRKVDIITGRFSSLALSVIIIAALYFSLYVLYMGPYDPHAQHRVVYNQNYVVHLQSDPIIIRPLTPLNLNLTIYDKKTGQQVRDFKIIQEKLMHIIITSKDLTYYDHIHPIYDGNGNFSVKTQLPREGTYMAYVEYSPASMQENISTITLKTQNAPELERAHLQTGTLTKQYNGKFKVTLSSSQKIRVNEPVDLVYTFINQETGESVESIEPYLGAFGHLAAISEDTRIFNHVHPIDIPFNASALGGPSIRFSTVFQKPGKYKLFAQFKESGQIFVTDFVINVP